MDSCLLWDCLVLCETQDSHVSSMLGLRDLMVLRCCSRTTHELLRAVVSQRWQSLRLVAMRVNGQIQLVRCSHFRRAKNGLHCTVTTVTPIRMENYAIVGLSIAWPRTTATLTWEGFACNADLASSGFAFASNDACFCAEWEGQSSSLAERGAWFGLLLLVGTVVGMVYGIGCFGLVLSCWMVRPGTKGDFEELLFQSSHQ